MFLKIVTYATFFYPKKLSNFQFLLWLSCKTQLFNSGKNVDDNSNTLKRYSFGNK